MAFIRSPQKWLQKPSGPVDPNLHSPLLVGAASLIGFGEGGNRPRDVLSGVSSIQADPAVTGAGTAPAWGAAQPGFGRRYFGNTNWNIGTADAFADADVYDVGSDDFSVFAVFTCTRSVAQLGGVIAKFDGDTKVGYALGVNTFNTSDGKVAGIFGSGNPHTELYSSPISAGKLCTAILSRAGSSVYFYVDGALAGGPSAVSGSLSNSKQLTLGALQQFLSSGNKTQFFHDGFIFAAGLIKGRAWRQAEAAEFAEAPFSVFKPLPRRTIYLPATSAGETVVGAGLTRSLKLNRLRLVA